MFVKKTIKMSKEEAISYYNSSNDNGFKRLLEKTFSKDFFKPKDITDLVYDLKTLEEYFGDKFKLPYDEDLDNDCKLEASINAFYILSKVAEVYNEKTILDWKNINQHKYLPYKYFSPGGESGVNGSIGWPSACLLLVAYSTNLQSCHKFPIKTLKSIGKIIGENK